MGYLPQLVFTLCTVFKKAFTVNDKFFSFMFFSITQKIMKILKSNLQKLKNLALSKRYNTII